MDAPPAAPPSRAFDVARRALVAGFAAQVPLGYAVALGYQTPLFDWHRRGLAAALSRAADVPAAAAPWVAQLAAMLGATMASWGVALAWVAHGPMRRREPWAFACAAASTLAWFAPDTAVSWRLGAWVNVAFNLAALALIGVPLAVAWATRGR